MAEALCYSDVRLLSEDASAWSGRAQPVGAASWCSTTSSDGSPRFVEGLGATTPPPPASLSPRSVPIGKWFFGDEEAKAPAALPVSFDDEEFCFGSEYRPQPSSEWDDGLKKHIPQFAATRVLPKVKTNLGGAGAADVQTSTYFKTAADPLQQAVPKTTLMLRNLPQDVTQDLLLRELKKAGMQDAVNFVHVCVNFKDKTCTGEAYINCRTAADAQYLHDTWQGRTDIGTLPCSRGAKSNRLNVVFSRKQGFDACVTETYRKQIKDSRLKAWVCPEMESRRRDLELAKAGRAKPAPAPSAATPLTADDHFDASLMPPPGLDAFPVGASFYF